MHRSIIHFFSQLRSSLELLILKKALVYQKIPSADGVYNKYLSHYGESLQVKQEFMPELELILNHIYYKKAQGEDYVDLLLFLRSYISQPSSQSTLQHEIDFLRQHKKGSVNESNIKPRRSTDYTRYSAPFQAFLQRQKQIVIENKLPYNNQNSAIAFLNIQDSSFEKSLLTDLNTSPSTKKQSIKDTYDALEQFDWHNIDIIVAHSDELGNAPQGYYNHVGLYSKRSHTIIEAVSAGVRESTWDYWAKNFSDFSILRFHSLEKVEEEKVEQFALSKLGEPFSLITHKENMKSGWYCSKFVYLAFLEIGVDLDIKNGVTIFPDDIVLGFSQGSILSPISPQ